MPKTSTSAEVIMLSGQVLSVLIPAITVLFDFTAKHVYRFQSSTDSSVFVIPGDRIDYVNLL